METPELDYEALIKLAKFGSLAEAIRKLEAAPVAIRPRRNAHACLLYAHGIVLFRKGEYTRASLEHIRAHGEWKEEDESAPNLKGDNLAAWFFAEVMAMRRRDTWPRFKMVLEDEHVRSGHKVAAIFVFVGGRRLCKALWPSFFQSR